MPWIPGYKPKRNFQKAIFDAIDRYLTTHPEVLQVVPSSPSLPETAEETGVPVVKAGPVPTPRSVAAPPRS